jgi:hypothetical protein
MKSYAHQRLCAKKIKKLAGGFSDEEIGASLGPDLDAASRDIHRLEHNNRFVWWRRYW